jgi:hypothetical protein
VEDQQYTNPFEDVHRKAKAFKDRAREANKNDAELRESRLVQEAKEIFRLTSRPPFFVLTIFVRRATCCWPYCGEHVLRSGDGNREAGASTFETRTGI